MPSKEKNDQLKKEKLVKRTSKKTASSDKIVKKSISKKEKKTDKKSATAKKTKRNIKAEKNTAKNNTISTKTTQISFVEHYDLPYRYNQTVVKVLAQTPTKLFAYWDMSDEIVKKFKETYGEDFLTNTKPVLIVRNDTMNYSFEVDVDDFAHGWYIDVKDANCNYSIELGRRAKYYNSDRHIDIPNNYIYISSSNEMSAPNDRILFDKNLSTVYFRDVKTNIVTQEKVSSISFIRNIRKLYNLNISEKDLTSMHKYLKLDIKNPSSGNPSSTFK